MLGAFKDVFGKKAADLHKKEFFDKKTEKKYTLKSKTADGVEFEGSADAKGAAELNLNFKDADMELKNKLSHEAKFTVDSTMFKVADGLDATLMFETPTADSKSPCCMSKIVVGGKYATADVNFNPTLTMTFDEETLPSKYELSAAVVAKIMDDVNAGINLTEFSHDGKGMNGKIDLGVSHIVKGCQLAAHANAVLAANAPSLESFSASFWQQATADTAVAAAMTIKTAEDKVKPSIVLGTEYKLTGTSTVKTKVTGAPNAAPTIDFAFVHKFNNKTLSLSHSKADGSDPVFGLSLTVDA
jgi:hypothetical protein